MARSSTKDVAPEPPPKVPRRRRNLGSPSNAESIVIVPGSPTERAYEALRSSLTASAAQASDDKVAAAAVAARRARIAAGETFEETAEETLARLRDDALSGPQAAGTAQFKLKTGLAFWLALGWIVLVALGAIFFDFLPLKSAILPLQGIPDSGPTWQNWLGTDQLGHDVFAQCVYGARYSMVVALVSVVVGVGIGGTVGVIAGFYRGFLEGVIVWFTDVLLTLPGLILVLTLVTFLGESFINVCLAIGLLSIPLYARITRAVSAAVSQRDFVLAGLSLGAKPSRVLFRDVLPLVALPVVSYAALGASIAILAEGALAFLGLTSPTEQSWGLLLSTAQGEFANAPWLTYGPMAMLFLTVLALNFIGQTFGAALDPRQARI